jgi:hypothetical protein
LKKDGSTGILRPHPAELWGRITALGKRDRRHGRFVADEQPFVTNASSFITTALAVFRPWIQATWLYFEDWRRQRMNVYTDDLSLD